MFIVSQDKKAIVEFHMAHIRPSYGEGEGFVLEHRDSRTNLVLGIYPSLDRAKDELKRIALALGMKVTVCSMTQAEENVNV